MWYLAEIERNISGQSWTRETCKVIADLVTADEDNLPLSTKREYIKQTLGKGEIFLFQKTELWFQKELDAEQSKNSVYLLWSPFKSEIKNNNNN